MCVVCECEGVCMCVQGCVHVYVQGCVHERV